MLIRLRMRGRPDDNNHLQITAVGVPDATSPSVAHANARVFGLLAGHKKGCSPHFRAVLLHRLTTALIYHHLSSSPSDVDKITIGEQHGQEGYSHRFEGRS